MKNPLSRSKSYFSGSKFGEISPHKRTLLCKAQAANGYSIKQMAIDAIEHPMHFRARVNHLRLDES
jgi:hypothetical protein